MTSDNLINWTQKSEDKTILGTRGRVDGTVRYVSASFTFSINGEEKKTSYLLSWYPRGPHARLVSVRDRIFSRNEVIGLAEKHALHHRDIFENAKPRPIYIAPKFWDVDHAVNLMRSIESQNSAILRDRLSSYDQDIESYPEQIRPRVEADSMLESMLSAYGVEIGLKTLWAISHPYCKMKRTHNIEDLINDLDEDARLTVESFGWTSGAIAKLKELNALKLFQEARYSPERVALQKGTITLNITDSMYRNSHVSGDTVVGQFAQLVSELKTLREHGQSWAQHDCITSECGEWWA